MVQVADQFAKFGATYSSMISFEEERIRKTEMWLCRYSNQGVAVDPAHHGDVWMAGMYVAMLQLGGGVGSIVPENLGKCFPCYPSLPRPHTSSRLLAHRMPTALHVRRSPRTPSQTDRLTYTRYARLLAQGEYVVFFICLLFGSVLWAIVVGTICGMIATGDPHEIEYRQTMDALK